MKNQTPKIDYPTALSYINIGKDDLRLAQLLYKQKEFRASYFYFQQATEKATKATTLIFLDLNNRFVQKEMGHNSLYAFEHSLKNKIQDFKETKNIVDKASKDSKIKIIGKIVNFDTIIQNMSEANQHFKEISSSKEIEFDKDDYENYLILCHDIFNFKNVISEIDFKKLIYSSVFRDGFKSLGISIKLMKPILQDVNLLKQFESFFTEFFYNFMTLYFCSILTKGHNNFARYDSEEIKTLEHYCMSNYKVEVQETFMRRLEFCFKILNNQIPKST